MSDEYLKEYKPKDAPCHYDECVKCGGHDASFTLAEFGLCLKCWSKYRKKIPGDVKIPLGRMLLYGKNMVKDSGVKT